MPQNRTSYENLHLEHDRSPSRVLDDRTDPDQPLDGDGREKANKRIPPKRGNSGGTRDVINLIDCAATARVAARLGALCSFRRALHIILPSTNFPHVYTRVRISMPSTILSSHIYRIFSLIILRQHRRHDHALLILCLRQSSFGSHSLVCGVEQSFVMVG